MLIDVFVENESGSDLKHYYDEKTLNYSHHVRVSRPYPFPYGFVLNTTSGDGDNVDCYIITRTPLQTGTTVTCRVVGLMEQLEDNEIDHNVIAVLDEENQPVTGDDLDVIREFVAHVFDHISGKTIAIGAWRNKEAAARFINERRDRP